MDSHCNTTRYCVCVCVCVCMQKILEKFFNLCVFCLSGFRVRRAEGCEVGHCR